MSFKRHAVLLSKYSESPSRSTRRVTRTSCQSTFNSEAQSVKVSETSAKLSGLRLSVPLKITSAISPPRSDLADCSPSTQRIASSRLDLPQPFGPTIAVTPSWKLKVVLSAKDLKPKRSSDCRCMPPPPNIVLPVNIVAFVPRQAKSHNLWARRDAQPQHLVLRQNVDLSCFHRSNHAPSADGRRGDDVDPTRGNCRSSTRSRDRNSRADGKHC